MMLIANALVALVAALHVYFLALEMFLWTKPLGLKTFRQTREKAEESKVLAANQGLYNGFLAAGPRLGPRSSHRSLCVPNQDFLPALRDRCRCLWRCDREPQDPRSAGGTGRHCARFAVPGLGQIYLCLPHHLALRQGFRQYSEERWPRPSINPTMRGTETT
jgi:Protein of unknown function (DUF1304)